MTFSIVCLTYKRFKLLEEAIYSVLQQTHKEWELLVINDNPLQTLHYDHHQIRIFNLKEKFNTIGEKRNFGLRNANGDLIIQLDDDDLFLPDYLENLNAAIGDSDWIFAQKPILYYDSTDATILSPVPQFNTFVYRRSAVVGKVEYQATNYDELTPFFDFVTKRLKSKGLYKQLKQDQYGYVYRQDMNGDRKYCMSKFVSETIDQQNEFLVGLGDTTGDITLVPHWRKHYPTIIKNNLKIPAPHPKFSNPKVEAALKQAKKDTDQWNVVKPTWDKAMSFLEAVKSRGIISTALDVTGVNKTKGVRVSDEVLKERRLSCFGDKEQKIAPCTRLNFVQNRGFFCGSCGCGNNNLARLDADSPDEYTKLHYPELECPLKRKGFSNAELDGYLKVSNKSPLSIIIPVLNDNEELNLTIQSIRDTSPPNVEIIVIDDKSDVPAVVTDKNVKFVRLEERKGVGATRHLGATMATSDYLLFVDSHMRFEKSWYNNVMKRLTSNPENIVWCGTCLGLDKDNMDIAHPKGEYHGARLTLYDKKENQIFEGKWIDMKEGDDYEISCLMGACYFFHKSWFMKIGGTKSLKMWGSDEPLLSAKTYLAGGCIKMMKDVKIGHKFRDNASYSTNVSYLTYNKLRSIKMLFSNELYEKLASKVQDDGDKQAALQMMEQDKEEIEAERQYYKTIFVKDETWLCEKFNLKV